jgi:hypothetical protein
MARQQPTPEDLRRLTEHFRAMGAFDPESWAKSQLEEGIPQFARLVFLRQAWQNFIAEDDTSWINPLIQEAHATPELAPVQRLRASLPQARPGKISRRLSASCSGKFSPASHTSLQTRAW